MVRASIGPVWDGNEVWLLTGAGAIFAAFPMVYAMTFSGFYLAIMLVLFGLILRAVSLEFRHRDAELERRVGRRLLPRQPGAGAARRRRPRQRHPRRADGRAGQLHRAPSGTCSTRTRCSSASRACSCSCSTAPPGCRSSRRATLHDRAWRYRKVTFWICAVLAVATSLATILTVSRASDNVFGSAAGWLFLVVFLVGVLYTIWQMIEGGRRAQVLRRLGDHHHRPRRHRRRGQLPRHGAGPRHAAGDQPHGGARRVRAPHPARSCSSSR